MSSPWRRRDRQPAIDRRLPRGRSGAGDRAAAAPARGPALGPAGGLDPRLDREELLRDGLEPRDASSASPGAGDGGARRVAAVMVALNAPFDWLFVADACWTHLGRNPFGPSALDIKPCTWAALDELERWADRPGSDAGALPRGAAPHPPGPGRRPRQAPCAARSVSRPRRRALNARPRPCPPIRTLHPPSATPHPATPHPRSAAPHRDPHPRCGRCGRDDGCGLTRGQQTACRTGIVTGAAGTDDGMTQRTPPPWLRAGRRCPRGDTPDPPCGAGVDSSRFAVSCGSEASRARAGRPRSAKGRRVSRRTPSGDWIARGRERGDRGPSAWWYSTHWRGSSVQGRRTEGSPPGRPAREVRASSSPSPGSATSVGPVSRAVPRSDRSQAMCAIKWICSVPLPRTQSIECVLPCARRHDHRPSTRASGQVVRLLEHGLVSFGPSRDAAFRLAMSVAISAPAAPAMRRG